MLTPLCVNRAFCAHGFQSPSNFTCSKTDTQRLEHVVAATMQGSGYIVNTLLSLGREETCRASTEHIKLLIPLIQKYVGHARCGSINGSLLQQMKSLLQEGSSHCSKQSANACRAAEPSPTQVFFCACVSWSSAEA